MVFTGQYCLHEEGGCNSRSYFTDVTKLEALDDHTVKVHFGVAKPFPYGPFVGSTAPIIQKAQFQDCMGARAQECTEQNFGPIGTGPFKVEEFRANDVITFSANELYRDPDKPAFATATFKGGGDAASAARAVLETSEFDYAWNLQVEPEVLAQMAAAGKGTVVTAFGTRVERLMVNQTNDDPSLGPEKRSLYLDGANPHPFLSDPAVRRALSLAIDRQILVEAGYGAAGQATCNVLPAPAVYASTANDACKTQDVDEANRILDEAGWMRGGDGVRARDGVRLSILYQTSTNSVRQGTQALIKQMWEQIGMETELRNVDAAVFFGGDPASPDTYMKFYADIEMYTQQLLRHRSRVLHGELVVFGDSGPGEPVARQQHPALMHRGVRRAGGRDVADRFAGGAGQARQGDERHPRAEPLHDPAHLARQRLRAREHPEGGADERVGLGALEHSGLAPVMYRDDVGASFFVVSAAVCRPLRQTAATPALPARSCRLV